MSPAHKSIGIYYDSEALEPQARFLAQKLQLPLCQDSQENLDFALLITSSGLMLQDCHQPKQKPLYIDFASGKTEYRRLHGGGKNQAIAKAVGIKSDYRPTVIDATAGLGQDSFVLASLGCNVSLIERSPIIASLLQDALNRAKDQPHTQEIISKMHLFNGEAKELISSLKKPDVIYLDPMFPDTNKTALAKKEMQILQALLEPSDESELLEIALNHAKNRVVVKRPKTGPFLDNLKPNLQLKGASNRFDIYFIR